VGAAEDLAHARAEVLSYPVAAQRRAGAATEGGSLVGGVRFRADDDDPLRRKGAEGVAAEPGEVCGVEDDEIWLFFADGCGEVGLLRSGAELPAGLVTLEQLDDQLSQPSVGHRDDDRRGSGAHGTTWR
jgi:hypothetical protein